VIGGQRADAVVVGAGVVGAAVARALAADGMRVMVLETGFAGGGTTSAGMGHVVVMDGSPAQLALTIRSRTLLLDLGDRLGAACEFDRCGTLWIAGSDAQIEEVHQRHWLMRKHGVASEVLDGAALADAEPELRRGLAGALRVADDVVLYPPGLARWLLDDAGARVELRCGQRVTAIGHRAVVARGERIECDIVVNAAGAHAPLLTPGLPVIPRKGHLVVTDRHPGFCRHQLVELDYLRSAHTMADASVAFNVQPRSTGQLLIGSSRELVGWDGSVNRTLLAAMLARAAEYLPGVGRLSAIRVWTGFRPATVDKLPLIGPWPEVQGLWVAAGHEGLGVTTALATAELLADLMAGRTPALDPLPFAPGRALEAAAPDA
jgi:glycine/D-amino acid oxidase-like deaminating enzyme